MSIRIDINFEGVDELVSRLEGTPEKIAQAVVDGLNQYADKAADDVKRETLSSLNLPQAYVEDRISVTRRATESRLVAEVTAPKRETLLGRFGAKQKSIANVWTKRDYIAKFGSEFARVRLPGKNGRFAPWIERKGDPMRGIQKGQKANGIAIKVKAKGNTKRLASAFLMPLRAGALQGGNGLGVFRRPDVGGKPKALYGPSLDQVARRVWTNESDEIADDLAQFVTNYLNRQLEF